MEKQELKKSIKEELVDEVVSTVRIGSLKKVKEVAPIVKVEPSLEEELSSEPKNVPLKAISKDDFTRRLSTLADDFHKQGRKGLASYLKDPLFHFEESSTILKVGSKALKNELDESFNQLKNQLRSEGLNWDFGIEINPKAVNEYKLFTPKQQYDALAKEYPPLKEFEQRFGLDFDV